MTIQYALFIKTKFGDFTQTAFGECEKEFAEIEDTAEITLEYALKTAMIFYKDEGKIYSKKHRGSSILGICSVDMDTGEIKQIYTRKQIIDILESREHWEDWGNH